VSYYYCSEILLTTGDVVSPGRWGQTVLATGPDHHFYYRELVWEQVRATEFPSRPSRMACAFAFQSEASALTWAESGERIYAVSVGPESPAFMADMTWITVARQNHAFADVLEIVRRYWRGEVSDDPTVELLVAGDLKINREVTAPDPSA
jgi:hypothetical protein